MALSKTNFTKQSSETPEILRDPSSLKQVAALGSFIFVRGGSLYEEMKKRGIDVKPGDSYT